MTTVVSSLALLCSPLLSSFFPSSLALKISGSNNLTASRFPPLPLLETPSPWHSIDPGLVLPCFFPFPHASAPFRCGVGSYKVMNGGS